MTCQWFLRLFNTECIVTQLCYIQATGESDKILSKKKFCREKKNFKKYFITFLRRKVAALKQTSRQALWNVPLKHWRRVVLSRISIKKWFIKLIQGITVILSNNFIQWDIIWTCWKWKQVGIYSGKLTLNS